jgi:hypothetical protein
MLDVRAAQIAALALPMRERFLAFTQARNRLAKASNRGRTLASRLFEITSDPRGLLASESETLARLEVCRVALAIERWRLAHEGRAPDTLGELTPEFTPTVPMDPFDGLPLRYKRLPRGFIIYSIGADFVDDGGKEARSAPDAEERHDVTFIVER